MAEAQAEFATRMMHAFPQLLPWLCEHKFDCQPPRYLAFCVPSPHSGDELWISLFDEEITVSFGAWHTHFDESELADAAVCVSEIVECKTGICEHYSAGRWERSSTVDMSTPEDWPIRIRQISETVSIRSWEGVVWEGKPRTSVRD